MLPTVTIILAVCAFVCAIFSARDTNKMPVWVPLILLSITVLLMLLPK